MTIDKFMEELETVYDRDAKAAFELMDAEEFEDTMKSIEAAADEDRVIEIPQTLLPNLKVPAKYLAETIVEQAREWRAAWRKEVVDIARTLYKKNPKVWDDFAKTEKRIKAII